MTNPASSTPEPNSDQEQLKRALLAIRKLRARNDELEQAARAQATQEPIAIVGIGCRLPGGVSTPAAFWELLRDGRDAIAQVPADRWDAAAFSPDGTSAPGTIATRYGGFLGEVDQFDPHFFGISPREAAAMDPQQRLVLETAWEALEDAGILPGTLAESDTGVFIGIGLNDYGKLQAPGQAADPKLIDAYSTIGNALCIAANRLSYVLDLRGPSMAIDTACSSSLVAIHQACRGLRSGDCSLALVGGSNLILAPDNSVSISKFLAPDGHCKFGDARADGYVRGEGVIMMVLAPLRRAQADGLPIYALIRGSALNQDGYSSGLTVPNGVAQQAMLRAALANAGIGAHDLSYVEAHGTGTALGDPIEVQALGAVLGAGRPADAPLLVGSVKANIGHLEAGAGIAGVTKLALALQHGLIPPSLHYRSPNPHIPFEQLKVRVVATPTPWPQTGRPPLAGVSSFGFGGANAHAILEQAPAPVAPAAPTSAPAVALLPLAARTAPALRALAGRYAARIAAQPDQDAGRLAAAAATRRTHFGERAAFVAADAAELGAQLAAFAAGAPAQATPGGHTARSATPKLAFLFTGQGAQYPGMGRTLYASEPAFRAALDRCAELLRPELGVGLLDLLFGEGPEAAARLDQTAYTQPALFALEYALAELWKSWGILPDAVLGHSVGEYVASCVAGVMSLEDGLRLIAARGRLMGKLPAGGAMAAIFAPPAQVQAALEAYGGRVTIAAHNEPEQLVISGAEADVEELRAAFAAQGRKARRLATSHAFHSPLMDPILDEFEAVARSVSFRPPQIALVSNLSGTVWAAGQAPDATYWRRHLRQPVRFADGMHALQAAGCTLFVELGPAPVLVAAGSRTLPQLAAAWLPSLRSGADENLTVRKSLGALYVAGLNPTWQAVNGSVQGRVDLPTYPFEHERYWFSQPARAVQRPASALHPLLDAQLRSPALAGPVFESELSLARTPLLDGHRVLGTMVFPAAAYVEALLAAAAAAFGGPRQIAELLVHAPLVLADDATRTLQIVFHDQSDTARFEVISRGSAKSDGWLTHVSGRLAPYAPAATDTAAEPAGALARAQAACRAPLDVAELYAGFAAMGMGYGPGFRGLTAVWRGEGAVLGHVQLPPAEHAPTTAAGFALHPALLDACLQLGGALLPAGNDQLYLPFSIEDFVLHTPPGAEVWALVELLEAGAGTVACRLRLFDGDGALLAEAARVVFKQAPRSALQELLAPHSAAAQELLQVVWQPAPLPAPLPAATAPGRFLVIDCAAGLGAQLAEQLAAGGAACTLVTPAATLQQLGADAWQANPADAAQLRALLAQLPAAEPPLRGVLFVAAPGAESAPGAEGAGDVELLLGGALHLAQALVQTNAAQPARLWFVTVGAHAVRTFEPTQPLAATLWGLGRVVAREHPELGCTCVDLDAAAPAAALAHLAGELLGGAAPGEDQLAWRDDVRLAARLAPLPAASAAAAAPFPVQLQIAARGSLDQLTLAPVAQPQPAPDQVVIGVRAAGLNFRDVLTALGMYPGDDTGLGHECAGRVLAVGAGVTNLAVGDAVVAIARDSIGDFALARAAHTLPLPPQLSFAQAATLPIAFATAAYALRTLAQLQPGETVLVHAAAGGVGLAAVQLAQLAGAHVIGTAGSAEKHAFLHNLGVEHVFDSRSLSFADDVRRVTGGKGVDVVLNSLAGDFITASFDVLRDGGQFLEIGKRDIWTHEQVAALGRGIDYHIIYLGDVIESDPQLVRTIFAEVMDEIAAGALQPLPFRLFALRDAVDAFRFMAQARHIGKVVLEPQPPTLQPLARADATWLITGGLGGLGLVVANELVAAGARALVLAGRRAPSAEAEQAMAALRAAGAQVLAASVDVSDAAALAALLARIERELPPLRGVVHAAGLLDDAPLLQQSWPRTAAVLAPKLGGALALHRLTAGHTLDWMIYFSAGAALIGAPGQANYAAANAYLDSLAQARRAQGLPALSINWGVWGKVGMAAALGERERRRLAESGLLTLAPADGARLLAAALQNDAAQVAAMPADWQRFGRQFPGEPPSLLRDLVRAAAGAVHAPAGAGAMAAAPAPVASLAERVAKAPAGNRRALVRAAVREQVGVVLALAPTRAVDPRQPLGELGLDSLMAVELRNSLGAAAGRALPTTLLFDYPTIEGLTEFLETLLAPAAPAETPASAATPEAASGAPRAALAADLEELSEEEAEALLLAELNGLHEGR